jgi:hypothetical protein
MGGSALLIYGTVSDELLQPRQAPRSLLGRLFGGSGAAAPKWRPLGRDRRMMDLPANDLKALGREFHSFVAARFQPPWKATASVLEYFALDVITVYLRGDQEGEAPPEWYVQLTFSGCAGMADVSSELATHWAERWYEADSERIANTLLRPHGFEPSGRTLGVGSGTLFVPIGAGGYATFSPTPREVDDDAERAESRYFEVDESVLETLDESELPDAMRKLDEELRPLIPPSVCCCQWCSPTLDVAALDRTSPFQ